MRRTLGELRTLPNPISERDVVAAADSVYGQGYDGADFQTFTQGLNHPDIVKFEDRLLAGAHQPWVEHVIEQTDGTIEVLPVELREDYHGRLHDGLWIEANSLLVSVRVRALGKIKDRLDTSHDPWIVNCPYTGHSGLEL